MSPTPLTSRKSAALQQTRAGVRLLMQHDLFALARVLYADWPGEALSRTFHGPLCRRMATSPYPKNLWLVFRGAFKTSVLCAAIRAATAISRMASLFVA